MKIRNGFVSNSSSTSFIIYGYKFLIDEDIYDNLKSVNITIPELESFIKCVDFKNEKYNSYAYNLEKIIDFNIEKCDINLFTLVDYEYSNDKHAIFVGCGYKGNNQYWVSSTDNIETPDSMKELFKNNINQPKWYFGCLENN